jgi:hypothetical protein
LGTGIVCANSSSRSYCSTSGKRVEEQTRVGAQPITLPCRCAVTELVWEKPLTILNYPDPRLRAPNARIGVFDDRLRQLAAEMFDVMYRQGRFSCASIPDG